MAHVLQQRLKRLRQDEEASSSSNSSSLDKGKQPVLVSSLQGDNDHEIEMADILNLLVEVDTKVLVTTTAMPPATTHVSMSDRGLDGRAGPETCRYRRPSC